MKVSVEPPVGRFFGHVASRPICERLERLDGVGEGEEPPWAGTLRTWQPVAGVWVGRMARRHVFWKVSRRSSRMQDWRCSGLE